MLSPRSVLFAFASVARILAAELYVSPSGSDSAAGSLEAPFLSIQKAVDVATAGTTIYLRAGTYGPSKNVQIGKSGTSSAPFIIRPYASEKVVVDGENMLGTPAPLNAALDNSDRGIFHIQNANYWQFYDLELINGPYGIYARDASNNHYERLITHDNYESGFQIQGASSNNLILNLDSYRNRDPRKNGESADGFACKEGSGAENILRGARLWDNVDDGLDLWEFGSPVTVEDTIAWGNGYNRWGFSPFEGDGNGFKLGGGTYEDADAGMKANHIVKNSIAFSNLKKGFIDNGNPASLLFERNTAWNNGDSGFVIRGTTSSFTANIAAVNLAAEQVSIAGAAFNSDNSWNEGESWSNGSFKSVDASVVQGARQSSGEIASSVFLLPASGEAIGATFL